jgi:hypothetical protein
VELQVNGTVELGVGRDHAPTGFVVKLDPLVPHCIRQQKADQTKLKYTLKGGSPY